MRIAHCIHGLDLGGAQQILKYIVRGTDKNVFRHYVYASIDGVSREGIVDAGAVVRITPRRLPKFDPFWARELSRTMKRDEIDVVHTYLFGDSLHGYLAARAAGPLPVVMSLHTNFRAQTWLQRLGYRWLLTRTTRNVACSDSVRRSFANGTRDGVAIETIPNGIEEPTVTASDHATIEDLKKSLGIDPLATVIGAVGRLAEEKGYRYLLSAYAQLVQQCTANLCLVLVGDGPLRGRLERQAEDQGIGNRVVFTGFRPDVSRLLPAFDVVAFSSLYEAAPVALLEAMSTARCIVATRAGGIMDAVSDGAEAILVPIRNPGRLCGALATALNNPSLRRALGESARRRFLREFTADRIVARYERVYREVFSQTRRRAMESGQVLAAAKHVDGPGS